MPNKLVFIPSVDKNDMIEVWYPGRNLLNIPRPFRMTLMGRPSTGKSLIVKNIILNADPPFEQILVYHCDPEASEYAEVGATVLEELPEENDEMFLQGLRTLLILDDISFVDLNKDEKRRIDRLCGFVSSHRNVSLCVCNQTFFSVLPVIRKCSNVFNIWSPADLDELNTIARRCGYKSKVLKEIFRSNIQKYTDSIMIDMTVSSPAPLRKNVFEKIDDTPRVNGLDMINKIIISR